METGCPKYITCAAVLQTNKEKGVMPIPLIALRLY